MGWKTHKNLYIRSVVLFFGVQWSGRLILADDRQAIAWSVSDFQGQGGRETASTEMSSGSHIVLYYIDGIY